MSIPPRLPFDSDPSNPDTSQWLPEDRLEYERDLEAHRHRGLEPPSRVPAVMLMLSAIMLLAGVLMAVMVARNCPTKVYQSPVSESLRTMDYCRVPGVELVRPCRGS